MIIEIYLSCNEKIKTIALLVISITNNFQEKYKSIIVSSNNMLWLGEEFIQVNCESKYFIRRRW